MIIQKSPYTVKVWTIQGNINNKQYLEFSTSPVDCINKLFELYYWNNNLVKPLTKWQKIKKFLLNWSVLYND